MTVLISANDNSRLDLGIVGIGVAQLWVACMREIYYGDRISGRPGIKNIERVIAMCPDNRPRCANSTGCVKCTGAAPGADPLETSRAKRSMPAS